MDGPLKHPNRPLSADELRQLKRAKALERAENAMDLAWKEEAELPAAWFGRMAALGVVCFFVDSFGWIAAFTSPRLSYYLNLVLKFSMTLAIVGCAALAIWGLIKGYQHEQAKRHLRETFEYSEEPASEP